MRPIDKKIDLLVAQYLETRGYRAVSGGHLASDMQFANFEDP